MKLLSLFVLATFSSLRGFASSFGVAESIDLSRRRRSNMASSSTTEQAGSDASTTCSTEDNNMKDEKKKPDKTLVKFVASRLHTTPPLPLPSPPATLDDFFSQKENCDLLFSAEATLTDVDNPSPELWDMLKDSTLYYRDALPDSTTTASTPIRFMELANAPMHFIGVTLHSTATVGIQYLKGSDFAKQSSHFGFPEFRFYLLSTNLEARGPPPLVWLFYKLIGKKQGEDGISTASASRFQTSGLTRVWAEASQKRVIFHNTARLESRLRIPSVLLSLMPFSVQHLEEKGSESLQTAIDKDMEPAAERFQEAYTQWLVSK
jgi:hypothetical protein